MHAWEGPTDAVTQAVTKVDNEDERPDPPDLEEERCQITGCGEPAKVTCWSTELSPGREEWFIYCEPHADAKTDEYPDLEVVD